MNTRKQGNEIGQLIERLAGVIQIDELAERLSIPIKRSGDRVAAQCVFHDDKNPSMVLYPGNAAEKPHFHCYVCNAHGDIFQLVKQTKGLDFLDAVEWLANAYGISVSAKARRTFVPPVVAPNIAKAQSDRGLVNTKAFDTALTIFKDKNPIALNEWLIQRGLAADVASDAELGFSDPATLVSYARLDTGNFGAARELLGQLEDSGLVRPERPALSRDPVDTHLDIGQGFRDFFRDRRVIFPIRDAKNYVVGFAGRRVADSSAPKYLYTPNLPKGSLLYRGQAAFTEITRLLKLGEKPVLYVCEGLMDALRLEGLGVPAVAVLGSRISEAQVQLIVDFATKLPDLQPLQVRVFFDKDGPGLKGAVDSLNTFLRFDNEIRLELGFVWPGAEQGAGENASKDPDDILRRFDRNDAAVALLDKSTYPSAVAFLSERLSVPPSTITDESQWETIPLGAKYRLALQLETFSQGLVSRVLSVGIDNSSSTAQWRRDVEQYLNAPARRIELAKGLSAENVALQLNVARELARAGANKGEVLSDIAAWRRIEIAATAFNEGFLSRLKQVQFQPIEPFDAVFVSRGFGKKESRLKTMPCPEDLIIQQYILNEILTERLDHLSPVKFSNYIPAVRYYRSLNFLRTTGESGPGEHSDTLSFAYQIDMDALEGRAPTGEGGMFRPYFECWSGFVSSLTRQGGQMSRVCMIRLDLRRYYDNVTRLILREVLIRCVSSAYESLGDAKDSFVPLFRPGSLQNEPQRAVVDLLLDQSFGFSFYHPGTGQSIESDREKGIPQGPVLSAWLGNIILFKLDAVMRAKLDELNAGGTTRAGYARYVDDVVLLGESEGILDVLRASAEDVVRILQLELLSKGSYAPMSTIDFQKHLTSGRALPAYGPGEEAILLESGDGDAGWGMWHTESPLRQTSLELLRDSRLYTLPSDIVRSQVFTALRAEDLRPAELAKASRWLWYQAAQSRGDMEYTSHELICDYWRGWLEVCAAAPFTLDRDLPWDDPAFYALEGLESLLERANSLEYGLTPEEASVRIRCVERLARTVRSLDFSKLFTKTDDPQAPEGWGRGAEKLSRMYFQRIICMRWKAVQLTGGFDLRVSAAEAARQIVQRLSITLQASLRRALITDAETCGCSATEIVVTAGGEAEWNTLSDSFQWLHRAIVAIAGSSNSVGKDPLSGFSGDLEQIEERIARRASHFAVAGDRFHPLLCALLPPLTEKAAGLEDENTHDGEAALLALQTLAAIAPRLTLPHLLSMRTHLLQWEETKLPLPPLPGVPANGLLLISHTANDTYWTKITAIWWMTLANEDEEERLPSFVVANSNGSVRDYVPKWQKKESRNGLEIFRAAWEPDGGAVHALVEPPSIPATPASLRWAADTYEAIARLNYVTVDDHESSKTEYVPAWPFIAVTSRPGERDQSTFELTLLSLKHSRTSLDGFGFVRNGSRGLRVYDVPELYGRHWRTGVFLSDLFGFSRDLDQFATLSSYSELDGDATENLNPANHLLRNTLRKLRGSYASSRVLQAHTDRPYIPATVARSLELLRGFPENGSPASGITYVVASESETVAMHLRLTSDVALEYPGVLAAYIEQLATKVVKRIPLDWSAHFSKVNTFDRLETSRIMPLSYWNLGLQLTSLAPVEKSSTDWERSLGALVAGLRLAALTTWMRELLFSVEALSQDDRYGFPRDGDVAEIWQIEERGFLIDRPDGSLSFLSEIFEEKIKNTSTQQSFENITPLGWLAILAARVGLLRGSDEMKLGRVWNPSIINLTRELAGSFAKIGFSRASEFEALDAHWPFELNDPQILADWKGPALTKVSRVLNEIESNVGLVHTERVIGAWRLDRNERTFTDTVGTKWAIAPWQVSVGGGTRPERIAEGARLLSIWGETRDSFGNLLHISARSDRLAKLLAVSEIKSTQGAVNNESEAIKGTPHGTDDVQVTTLIDAATFDISKGGGRSTDDLDETETNSQAVQVAPANGSTPSVETAQSTGGNHGPTTGPKTREQWREQQRNAWQLRRAKSPGHIRIALMQWKLHESYHHPAIDATQWNKQWPPGKLPKDGSAIGASGSGLEAVEESQIEERRRKFLDEALIACESFGVELLVLPEYSVRPETIGWLKDQLQRRAGAPAVIAGTFKLHGRPDEVNFSRVYSGILGLAEFRKTFDPGAVASGSSRRSYLSGEHSSMLTMLAPLELESERVVCVFSRRKKYPSMSASEIFNPPIEAFKPLFSSMDLLDELENRTRARGTSAFATPVSARQILAYTLKLSHLEWIAEFICSELFLPMSLANQRTLAAELLKLARRFGSSWSESDAMENLRADVEKVSQFLGMSEPSCETKRRSILVVPAMTSRSADYWIFGQAALLAGGATTVFCNAVVDKLSIGGSCFVGRNSWNGERENIHHDKNITPYAGWSKGIYYGNRSDALGEREQAMVIADIDPAHMQEGKPRPQSLANPLQLVAYLPIVEVSDKSAARLKENIEQRLASLTSVPIRGHIVDPATPGIAGFGELVVDALNESGEVSNANKNASSFKDRLNHWKKYWSVNPHVGMPPTLVDWLWVDNSSTLQGSSNAEIYIFGHSDDPSVGPDGSY